MGKDNIIIRDRFTVDMQSFLKNKYMGITRSSSKVYVLTK